MVGDGSALPPSSDTAVRAALRAALAAGHAEHYRLEAAEDAAGLTAEQVRTLTAWRTERVRLRRALVDHAARVAAAAAE
jgi:hypothetical protein